MCYNNIANLYNWLQNQLQNSVNYVIIRLAPIKQCHCAGWHFRNWLFDGGYLFLLKESAKMRKVYIYGLFDPRTYELRYIGKSYNPSDRLYLHILEARKNKDNSHKSNWIRKLLKDNLEPRLKILEVCSENNWGEKEKLWIKSARDGGLNIVNVCKGGENPPTWNELTKEQQSYIREKRTIANKTNPTNKGRKWSEEYKEKMRKSLSGKNNPRYGKHLSEESRKKISNSLKGKDISHLRNAHTIETGKKVRLSYLMSVARKNNNLDKLFDLQVQYFNICGRFNLKYVLWTF